MRGRTGMTVVAVVRLGQLEGGGHEHLVGHLQPDGLLSSGLGGGVWLWGRCPLPARHLR